MTMETCGACARRGCQPFLVWNMFEERRTLMCTQTAQKTRFVYSQPLRVSLAVEPTPLARGWALEYCTECEEAIEGEDHAPGIRLADRTLCRECFTDTDDAVFAPGGTSPDGIPPAVVWAMLWIGDDVREAKYQLFRAYRHNEAVAESLIARLERLCITDYSD